MDPFSFILRHTGFKFLFIDNSREIDFLYVHVCFKIRFRFTQIFFMDFFYSLTVVPVQYYFIPLRIQTELLHELAKDCFHIILSRNQLLICFPVKHQTMQSICFLQIQHEKTTNLKTTELMVVSESTFVCQSNSLKAQYVTAIFKLRVVLFFP